MKSESWTKLKEPIKTKVRSLTKLKVRLNKRINRNKSKRNKRQQTGTTTNTCKLNKILKIGVAYKEIKEEARCRHTKKNF